MGKKPFILIAIGLFLIVGAFTFGVSDPTCGRGQTMSPGEVCKDPSTGDEQSYAEAKAQQNKEIQIGLPVIGGALIVYGLFTAVTRKRNPNWRAAAAKGHPIATPGAPPTPPKPDATTTPPQQSGPSPQQR